MMDSPTPEDEEKKIREPLLSSTRKGGLRTIPFIIVNEALEKVASLGILPNMIMYLMDLYHLDMVTGSNIVFLWSSLNGLTPVLAACFADSSVGRFPMIGFGSVVSFLGMLILWLTTMFPQTRPPPCNDPSDYTCSSPTIVQLVIVCSSFLLLSMGAGGIRSSSLAFGVDQLGKPNTLNNARVQESYLMWYYAASAVSAILAMTGVVYIQENYGWQVGFGVPVLLMLLAAISFFMASPFYVKLEGETSLFTSLVQVIVASYKNRQVQVSPHGTNILYYHKKGSMLVAPSDQLRFFNKACLIKDPQQDLTPEGKASDPWRLCTVDKVEELKTLIKVIPIWSTGIIMSMNSAQVTFGVLQASSMDRHITPSFQIPAGSFTTFMLISLALWILIYDRLILPLASKITGRPVHISAKHRIGIGLFLSFLLGVVKAIVEGIRRTTAIKEGYIDDPKAVLDMSFLWLLPQYCLSGVAEAFNVVGQNEFYLSEFPTSMASIASNLGGVGMFISGLLSSLFISAVDNITRRGGRESWVSSNINKGHYDYYFWVLAGLNLLNFVYYLACSRAYVPYRGNQTRFADEEDEVRDE